LSIGVKAQEKQVKIFPFKSAIIEYKYEAGLSGTHVKYIDDYGYKQVDIIKKEINIDGEINKEFQTIILIGNKAYTINYQDTTVAVGRNSTYTYYFQHQNRNPLDVSEALIRAQGFKLNGTKIFLGKECQVWKADMANKLIWEGVELKSTINFFMMMVEKAIKIELDVEIPKSKFQIPQGFCYISSDHYQGYAGLQLEFDKSKKDIEVDGKSIKVKFSTSSLGGTSNIPFYTQKGEEVIQNGVNDFNKIDFRVIISQVNQLQSREIELVQSSTLIFYQEGSYGKDYHSYGKIQIDKIDVDSFTYRYMIFGNEGEITGYSNNTSDALVKIMEIKPDKNNWKLIISPKNKTKMMVLGW
jgi:hypothetical protein